MYTQDIPRESTSPGRGETSAPSVVTEGSDYSDKVGSDAATHSSGDQPTEQFDESHPSFSTSQTGITITDSMVTTPTLCPGCRNLVEGKCDNPDCSNQW